mgnify:CR=1 FL=1
MSAARIYYLFMSLIHIGMACTVTAYTPFLQSIGLSLGEIALVNAIFWSTIILAELPTGMIADGRSRAFSLKLGGVFYAVGALAYTQATGFWSAALSESLIGIGGAFISGAGQAWIADALTREGRYETLRHVYATESLLKSVFMLLGGFAGAAIALVDYRLIWVPFVVSALLASFIAHRSMNGKGEPLEYVTEFTAFRLALAQLKQSRALLWAVAALMVFGAVISFNHYWALYFKPVVGQLGLSWIWAVMYVGLIGASQYARRSSVPLGRETGLIVLSLFLSGLGLGLIALAPSLLIAVPALVIHEIGRGLFDPLTSAFVQHRVHTSYRATFGSLQSFLGRMGFAVVPLVVWLAIDGKPDTTQTISQVWLICALFLILGSGVLWFTRPKSS